jgi:hypothetical protein
METEDVGAVPLLKAIGLWESSQIATSWYVSLQGFRGNRQPIEPAFADEKTFSLQRSQRRGDSFARGADRLTEELVR